MFAAATGGVPDYTYLWTNLETGDTEDNTTWGGLNPGNYQVSVTDAIGCVLTEEIFLDSLNPEALFTINSDQLNSDCMGTGPVEIEFINNSINFANPNDPGADTTFSVNLDFDNITWVLSEDINDTFDTLYLARDTSYDINVCLVAQNKNGCTDTTCKIVTVFAPIEFEPINIFTPDGDGVNDDFTFDFRTMSIATFRCIIINRWGVTVGEINSIDEGWDGNNINGEECVDGVYFYNYIAVSDNNTKLEGQGTVQLIRD